MSNIYLNLNLCMVHSSTIKKQNNTFVNKNFSPKRILEDFGYVDQRKILLLMIPKFAFYHLFPRKNRTSPAVEGPKWAKRRNKW